MSSFIVLQFMARNTPLSKNISDKLFFFSHQVAAKFPTKIISVNLTGLEPIVVKSVKYYVAGYSGMPFSERPFALGLFFRKTNEAAVVCFVCSRHCQLVTVC